MSATENTFFGNWKTFKNDEKHFWFHLQISLLSEDINFFGDFLFMQKNGLFRKIRLISKFIKL